MLEFTVVLSLLKIEILVESLNSLLLERQFSSGSHI